MLGACASASSRVAAGWTKVEGRLAKERGRAFARRLARQNVPTRDDHGFACACTTAAARRRGTACALKLIARGEDREQACRIAPRNWRVTRVDSHASEGRQGRASRKEACESGGLEECRDGRSELQRRGRPEGASGTEGSRRVRVLRGRPGHFGQVFVLGEGGGGGEGGKTAHLRLNSGGVRKLRGPAHGGRGRPQAAADGAALEHSITRPYRSSTTVLLSCAQTSSAM